MTESDFKKLLDKLEEIDWEDPVRWRLRTKWSEYVQVTQDEVPEVKVYRQQELPLRTGLASNTPKRRRRTS